MAEAVRLGKIWCTTKCYKPWSFYNNAFSNEELRGPLAERYFRMINSSSTRRAGTPEEVANVASLLMSNEGSFITGSDFLIDGGVTASY